MDSAGEAARDRLRGIGREYRFVRANMLFWADDESCEEYIGAWEGDCGMGMEGVLREGDIARDGDADRRDGDEPRGRLYGSKRSSCAAA
jgi:hypothetical protein